MYRGQLKDGRIVAVKRLKVQGGPDADSIISTEVQFQLSFFCFTRTFWLMETLNLKKNTSCTTRYFTVFLCLG